MRRKHKQPQHQHVFKNRLSMLNTKQALEMKPFMNFQDREYRIYWNSRADKTRQIEKRKHLVSKYLIYRQFEKCDIRQQSLWLRFVRNERNATRFAGY